MLMLIAIIPASAMPASSEGLDEFFSLRHLVREENACALPGVSIKYDSFIPCMWKAVASGHVQHKHATFVADGLRNGFMAGVDTSLLQGHRWFRNYESALINRAPITQGTMKRVRSGKTLRLGTWTHALGALVRATFGSSAIFPMGAVPKPGSTEMRATDDHTRTGLNAATVLEFLKHSLSALNEISEFLLQDYFMRVSDVDAAFTLLPLHPDVWQYFMFRFFHSDDCDDQSLFMHVCGDFGAAGMPGTFKIFFSDVVVGMARSARVLTLPMPIYVDDCSAIGGCRVQVDAEMDAFHEWADRICGVFFKAIKDRLAAQRQLVLGFWWDSTTFSRTLDESKLLLYVDMLADFSSRRKLSLRDMQVVAGRVQRCIMTFPPGAACLLVSLFSLMVGLRLPWHARRTTRRVRTDLQFIHNLLQVNLGRGFYSYKHFKSAPEVRSDACKGRYCGGGYVSQCGRYNFWEYGSRAARQLIDYLEGDCVVLCVEQLGHLWKNCTVPFGIDNSSFEFSAEKGRSRVERLNVLVRRLFWLQLEFQCIISYFWLCSADNWLADLLSRNHEGQFIVDVVEQGYLLPGASLIRHEEAGKKRVLPERRGEMGDLGEISKVKSAVPAQSSSKPQTAPPLSRRISRSRKPSLLGASLFLIFCVQPATPMPAGRSFASTVQYSRTSIFSGLPLDMVDIVEGVLDNRLSTSSWRTVKAGVKLWRAVAVERGWSAIIHTDDPHRGAKLVTFVGSLLTDTALVWGSISAYVWGVRTWMTLQHQADPGLGLELFDNFLAGVKVLTWVAGEPRRRVPLSTVEAILDCCDLLSFMAVQFCFFMLLCLFSFSRSECPCPKVFAGRDQYNKNVHWRVEDFDVRTTDGKPALWVRFRAIKQDPRVERPEASGDGDWAMIGDIEGSKFSIITWFVRLQQFHGRRSDREGPFFVDESGRPFLYRVALGMFKQLQLRVGVPPAELAGLHGLRVEGWNATKARLGEDVAVAHGLWKSRACLRYDRFKLSLIYRIPAAIVGLDAVDNTDMHLDSERDAGPPSGRLTRAVLARPSNSEASVVESEVEDDALLPPGWTTVLHDGPHLSRAYKSYTNGDGLVASARVQAWRLHEEHLLHADSSDEELDASSVRYSPLRNMIPVEDAADLIPFWDRPPNRRRPSRSAPGSRAPSP